MNITQLVQQLLSLPPAQRAAMLNQFKMGLDKHLGIEFSWVDTQKIEATCQIPDIHLQPYGLVHGGVYATIGESLCSVGAAMSVLKEGKKAVGIENRTQFLKAMRRGSQITAAAIPVQQTEKHRVWRANLYDESSNLCAISTVTVAILPGEHDVAGETLSFQMPVGH